MKSIVTRWTTAAVGAMLLVIPAAVASAGPATAADADVGVVLTDTPDPLTLGTGPVTYKATFTNFGPATTTNVEAITYFAPSDPATQSITIELVGAPAGCTTGSLGAAVKYAACDVFDFTAGEQFVMTVKVTPSAPGVVQAQANVNSPGDPNSSNNSVTGQTTVLPPPADLAVNLGATAGTGIGSRIDYTLDVTNVGPTPMSSATVRVTLPTAVNTVSTISSGCTLSGPTEVTCTYGAIAAGATVTRAFRANLGLLPIGALPATAVLTSSTPTDSNALNNTDLATCTAVTGLIINC